MGNGPRSRCGFTSVGTPVLVLWTKRQKDKLWKWNVPQTSSLAGDSTMTRGLNRKPNKPNVLYSLMSFFQVFHLCFIIISEPGWILFAVTQWFRRCLERSASLKAKQPVWSWWFCRLSLSSHLLDSWGVFGSLEWSLLSVPLRSQHKRSNTSGTGR